MFELFQDWFAACSRSPGAFVDVIEQEYRRSLSGLAR